MTNKVDAIFCADLHLMERVPPCRTDKDFIKIQLDKIYWILTWQDKYECPVFVAGDIFDKSRLSKESDIRWIEVFNTSNRGLFVIPGQHDLPNHNIEKFGDSSLGVVEKSVEDFFVDPVPFETISTYWKIGNRNIAMIHKLIHKNNDSKIKADGKIISYSAKRILKENPDYDVIVSGDNHKTFVQECQGRLLVNPGSMLRLTAAQIDHRPCVFLYNAENNTVRPEYFPIKKSSVVRDYIDIEKEHSNEMDAYVDRLNDNEEIGLSYDSNMKKFLQKNNIEKSVVKKIWSWME
ncbi:MAG: metallophosphoesterase family protein [Nitrosopumilaceae archaeon]|jgi:DNA repair exonuclease SbcCD nuclease subunit